MPQDDAGRSRLYSTALPEPPKALLVALEMLGGEPEPGSTPADLLAELGQLATTLGMRTAEPLVVRIREPQSGFLVGSGKAQEIIARAKAEGAEVIVLTIRSRPPSSATGKNSPACRLLTGRKSSWTSSAGTPVPASPSCRWPWPGPGTICRD